MSEKEIRHKKLMFTREKLRLIRLKGLIEKETGHLFELTKQDISRPPTPMLAYYLKDFGHCEIYCRPFGCSRFEAKIIPAGAFIGHLLMPHEHQETKKIIDVENVMVVRIKELLENERQ